MTLGKLTMNIVWFLDKEFDVALNVSARLATIKCLERKHRVHIVTSFRKQKRSDYDIKSEITYLDKINLPFIKTVSLFHRHLEFLDRVELANVDVVLVNSNNPFLLKKLIRLRGQNNLKLFFDLRSLQVESNTVKKKINEFLLKKSLLIAAEHFDGVTYITDELREYCKKKYSLPEHRTAVWGSGVDLEIFKPEKLPRETDRFRVMYHGVVSRKRGIDVVLEAMSKLGEFDIEFLLLGSGEEILELKNLAQKLRLENRVHFESSVPHTEVPKYINRADVGILPFPDWPGWNTSSPIKLFEYLACGKPVIVTRIPAHSKILDKKSFAFWADPLNPQGVTNAILRAYENKNNFETMGNEARNFVTINFSWEKQISKLEEFFNIG